VGAGARGGKTPAAVPGLPARFPSDVVWFNSSVSARPAVSEYRFAQSLLVRSMGALLALVGVLVFLVALLVALTVVPPLALTVMVVVGLLAIVGGAVWLSRFSTIVRFDAEGYQVRMLRGAGVKAARWADVEDSVTSTRRGHDCIVLRLRDGRTTTVPVDVLDTTPQEFVDDLRARLDKGRGYRRLR
jgi:hypothetical protein